MTKINNYQTTRLDNGLEVITDYMPSVESLCLGVWTDVGSRHEVRETNGIAHFLEHMVFKGTPTKTALDIAHSVDERGAHINAYTSKENTAYYIRSLAEDMPFSLNLISDIIQNPLFPEEELEREKGVVIQEIGMYLDTPDDLVFDDFAKQAYGDTSFGRNILGPVKTVSSFTQDDLTKYLKAFYHSGSMKIVASGRIDHDEFCTQVEKEFNALPYQDKINTFEPARYQGGVYLHKKELEQVHILLGYESCSYTDEDYPASQLLASLLGGGDSSRIYQEVREKRGLAYSTYAYQDSARDTGMFMIYAGTGVDVYTQTYDVLCQEIKKVLQDGIDIKELDRAKAQKRASLIMGAESSYMRADRAGRHALFYPALKDISETVQLYNNVTKEDIERCAKKIFMTRPTVTFLGDLDGKQNVDVIEEKAGFNRDF